MFRSIQQLKEQQEREAREKWDQSRNCSRLCDALKDKLIVKKDESVTVSDQFLNALGMNDAARKVLAKEIYNDFHRMSIIEEAQNNAVNKMMAVKYSGETMDLKAMIKPWFATLEKLISADYTNEKYLIVQSGLNQMRAQMKLAPLLFNDVSENCINEHALHKVEKFIKRMESSSDSSNDSSDESDDAEDHMENKASVVKTVSKIIADAPAKAAFEFTKELVKMSGDNDREFTTQLSQALTDFGRKVDDEPRSRLGRP